MMFRVGQKVVCVNVDSPPKEALSSFSPLPLDLVKGAIYTVTSVGVRHPCDLTNQPCVTLAEKHARQPYWASRFRPLVERKTDISVFTRMLIRATEKV
jgi:hypothetical protein